MPPFRAWRRQAGWGFTPRKSSRFWSSAMVGFRSVWRGGRNGGIPATAERRIERDQRRRPVRAGLDEAVARGDKGRFLRVEIGEVDEAGAILAAREDRRIVGRVEGDDELLLALVRGTQ